MTAQYLGVRARILCKTILALRGSAAPPAVTLAALIVGAGVTFRIISQPSNFVLVCTSFVSIPTVFLRSRLKTLSYDPVISLDP